MKIELADNKLNQLIEGSKQSSKELRCRRVSILATFPYTYKLKVDCCT